MNAEDPKISELKLSTLIRLFRELAFLGVLVFLAVKLFSGNLGLDFAKLSATELVNLLLAFFSIALSAAFYFELSLQHRSLAEALNFCKSRTQTT